MALRASDTRVPNISPLTRGPNDDVDDDDDGDYDTSVCGSCTWWPKSYFSCWSQFHLCKFHGEVAVFIGIPVYSFVIHFVSQVPPVQTGPVTLIIPPCTFMGHSIVARCTTASPIIIFVLGGAFHVVVGHQGVSCCAWIRAHTQLVQRLSITNLEIALYGVGSPSIPIFHLH